MVPPVTRVPISSLVGDFLFYKEHKMSHETPPLTHQEATTETLSDMLKYYDAYAEFDLEIMLEQLQIGESDEV
jgi:hypothetical protein